MEIETTPIFKMVQLCQVLFWIALVLLFLALIRALLLRRQPQAPTCEPPARGTSLQKLNRLITISGVIGAVIAVILLLIVGLSSTAVNDVQLRMSDGTTKTIFLSYKYEIGKGVSDKTSNPGAVPSTHVRVRTEPTWSEPYILVPRDAGDVISARVMTVSESFLSFGMLKCLGTALVFVCAIVLAELKHRPPGSDRNGS
jgi:preprotein translocase subunit YajC